MTGPCTEVRDHLAAYVDKEVEDEVRAIVQAHVEQCLACREEIEAQFTLKRQLQAHKRREAKAFPPPQIWTNVVHFMDQQDGLRRRRLQVRFALAAACMLLLLFGTVWARLSAVYDFPVEATLRDFRTVRAHSILPAYRTGDADVAARYLRERLNVDLPPLNLVLSRSQLLGADVMPMGSLKCGRLIYRTPHGLVGIYIVPRGTQFKTLNPVTVEGQSFALEGKNRDLGLYGWHVGHTGYGLVTAKPLEGADSILLDAERNTRQPGQ